MVSRPVRAATHGPDRHATTMVPIMSRNSGSLSAEHRVPPMRLIPTAIGISTRHFVENCALIPSQNDSFLAMLALLYFPTLGFPQCAIYIVCLAES